ncbi:hypothetical protein KBI51_00980 [Aerococcaceae bacterium zg-ZUI334]|uniref:lipoate--protein ligase family protein n=1 Tax=Aerococcaceae bacterium zg-252 TaxID=2796928 RepID=UPI001B922545|nr:hypothetical protein [Aerococcaceae bacterium zg-ZUI334]
MLEFFNAHQWLYSSIGSGNHIAAGTECLAWQDTFIRYIQELNQTHQTAIPYGIIHTYHIQQPTVILGPKDTKLNQLSDGIQFLIQQQHVPILRAHGGLAVVSDPGTLNISYISDTTHCPLSIDEAYEQMIDWIHTALLPFGLAVESYEVPQSYCPGKYDIVINQQKIGGIAQRRFKNGVATAAYISVNGNQLNRANLIHDFYQRSAATNDYPDVQAAVMATVNDFVDAPFTVASFERLLLDTISQQRPIQTLETSNLAQSTLFQSMLQKSEQRNQSLF